MTNRELMLFAKEARENAYAPYSGFKAGAALLTKEGKVYTGCNIENSSFSPTICAERTAIFKAVSEKEREFSKIAIVGGCDKLDKICSPCGVCRQVMAEFMDKDFVILLGTPDDIKEYKINDLLPLAFGN